MAGQSGKRPSSPRSAERKASSFGLLPLGKHTGKPVIPLTRPVLVVGSRESCRIHLTSSSVSQQHALLVLDNGTFYISDLASRTHVIVNGKRVQDRDLADGDELNIGSFVLKFTGPASKTPGRKPTPAAALDFTGEKRSAPLTKRAFVIGRRGGSDIMLADTAVSTMHAVIFEMNGQRVIRDLGSRTGTWINGVQVHQHVLNPGDQIKIGPSIFTFRLADQAAATSVATHEAPTPESAELDALIAPSIESAASAPEASDDFGLDFLEADAAAPASATENATAESVDLSSVDLSSADPSSASRRGWRAIVPEPIEPAAIEPAAIEPAALEPIAIDPPAVVEESS